MDRNIAAKGLESLEKGLGMAGREELLELPVLEDTALAGAASIAATIKGDDAAEFKSRLEANGLRPSSARLASMGDLMPTPGPLARPKRGRELRQPRSQGRLARFSCSAGRHRLSHVKGDEGRRFLSQSEVFGIRRRRAPGSYAHSGARCWRSGRVLLFRRYAQARVAGFRGGWGE